LSKVQKSKSGEEKQRNLPPVVVKLRALAAQRQRAEAQAT